MFFISSFIIRLKPKLHPMIRLQLWSLNQAFEHKLLHQQSINEMSRSAYFIGRSSQYSTPSETRESVRSQNTALKQPTKENEDRKTVSCYKCNERYFPSHHYKSKTMMAVEELITQEMKDYHQIEEQISGDEDNTGIKSIQAI